MHTTAPFPPAPLAAPAMLFAAPAGFAEMYEGVNASFN